VQRPPAACWTEQITKKVDSVEDGRKVTRNVTEKTCRSLTTVASDVRVNLDLEYRRKGLLWFSTYRVDFSATTPFATTQVRHRM